MPETFFRLVAEALSQYQSLSLVVMAIGFTVAERFLPHHPVDRRRDALLDITGAAAGLTFVVIAYGVLHWLVELTDDGLSTEALHRLRGLHPVIKILLVVILADFTIYWLHRFMHAWRYSWRMHQWHHSIEQMYWFAGFRASFPHIFLYGIPQVVLPVLVFELGVVGTAVASGIANFVQIWTHTNVRVNIGPFAWLFVTPDYHRVHHRASGRRATNFSNVFTVWDRLFGTYEPPPAVPVGRCGLAEPRPGLPRMLLGI